MSTKLDTIDTTSLSSIAGGVKPGDGGCIPQPFPRPRPPFDGSVGGPIVEPINPLLPQSPIRK